VALVQKDFKFIIGYSSVSHMGFVLLGLATLNRDGMSGAVLQMFSHGIIASLLFAVVGRMVYDRTHTRQLDELGGLSKVIPFACVTFIIGGAASMGMPGFSGFVAEIQVLIGAFKMSPWLAAAAGASIAVTAAYILNAINKVFFGKDDDHAGHAENGQDAHSTTALPAITMPEVVAAVILMAALVIIGLYPQALLTMIQENVDLFLKGVS
jgi:NADH-quinone oxidoreductase subunit M